MNYVVNRHLQIIHIALAIPSEPYNMKVLYLKETCYPNTTQSQVH